MLVHVAAYILEITTSFRQIQINRLVHYIPGLLNLYESCEEQTQI